MNNYLSQIIEYLSNRKSAYQMVFNDSVESFNVMKDLAKFCRANKSTFHPDPHMAARLDGRREVWLRIQNHLNLTPDQLYQIFGKGEQ